MAVASATPSATGSPREPQVAIALADQPLDDAIAACVLDLNIEQTLDQADHLSMRLATWDPDTDQATWIDDARFAAGAGLAIQLGYGEALGPVFDGDIVGLGLELHGTERPVMTIDAYNRIHRLGRGRAAPATQPAQQSTYGDLVNKIAKRYGLTARVEGSDADQPNDTVKQQNESDLQFITKLATEIGYVVYVDGKDLVFRKDVPAVKSALTIEASELLELSGHIDMASQIAVIDGSAFDHDKNKSIPYQAKNPDSFDRAYGSEDLALAQPLAVDSKEQLQARIDAEMLRIRNSYLAVSATAFGRTDLKLGMVVTITGVARRFDGDFTVTALGHSFSQAAGFRTRITLKAMKGSRP